MKIAVWHNLPSGGGKRALYYHIKGLVERGHAVECWCPPTADQSYMPLTQLAKEHVRPLGWPNIPSHPLSHTFAQARTLLNQLRALELHCRLCALEMERRGFDVIFANSCMFFRVPAIGRHASLPAVLYLQEPYRPLYEALPQLPWIALPPLRQQPFSLSNLAQRLTDYVKVRALRIQAREELLGAQAFTSILVNSLFSRESLLRAYGLDPKVCYLGVDTTLFVDRALPREGFVVGIGSFTREKRIDFVIKALAYLPRNQRRLVWIGNIVSATYLDELKGLASGLHVAFDVRIALTDSELVDVLNRAALMAYAPRLEPFGLAPLEANACGLPVVAVAEGGVRETVVDGQNGLLCEPEPEAMAAAIASLLDDPGYCRRLGERARLLAGGRWSIDAAVTRLEDRLAETLAAHRKSILADRPASAAAPHPEGYSPAIEEVP